MYDVTTLKVCFSAASPLFAPDQARIAVALGVDIRQGYGATETSPTVCIAPVTSKDIAPGSIGRCLPNTILKVVDENRKMVAPGVEGDLWSKGPQVMTLGYLNRPDATSESMTEDGYYILGDLARIDEKGDIFIGARKKEMIKVMGFQVAPAELEQILMESPHVKDACALGVKDPLTGESPIVFVVLEDPAYDVNKLKEV